MKTESVMTLISFGLSAVNRRALTRRSFGKRNLDGAAIPRSDPARVGAGGISGMRLDNACCITQLHRCGEACVEAFACSCVAGA